MISRERYRNIGVGVVLVTIALMSQVVPLMTQWNGDGGSKKEESQADESVSFSDTYGLSEPEEQQEDGLLELELIGYLNAVESFSQIDVDTINYKISKGEEFFLFVGRPTCKWCRRVAPALQAAAETLDIDICYLDSTDSDSDKDIYNFRKEMGIDQVPSVIKFSADQYKILDIDLDNSDMESEVISAIEEVG